MAIRILENSDLGFLLALIQERLKQLGFETSRGVNPIIFQGIFVPGRPGFLLREGVVSLEIINTKTALVRATLKISLVNYIILFIVASLINIVFFLQGRDIYLFAAMADLLLLYIPAYWRVRSWQLERKILQFDQAV